MELDITEKAYKQDFYGRLGTFLSNRLKDGDFVGLESVGDVKRAITDCRKHYNPIPINEIKAYLMKSISKEDFNNRVEKIKGLGFKKEGDLSWLEFNGQEIPNSRKIR